MDEKYDIIVFTPGPQAYAPLRIKEEADKLGLKSAILPFSHIGITYTDGQVELSWRGKKMPESRSVFMRGLGEDSVYNSLRVAMVDWYERHGTKVLNHDSFTTWPSLDKATQYVHYAKGSLPIVESFSFSSVEDLRAWAPTNYPFIAKDVVGSCGKSVYKITNENDLEKLISVYSSVIKVKLLLIQRLLPKPEDLRIIVVKDKALGAIKRVAKKGSFLSNYSQGGSVEKYDLDLDPEAKGIALSVAKLFKLDYCGVDLMRNSSGNWVILEVNRACQFEGFEKATKKNVAKEVVEYLVS